MESRLLASFVFLFFAVVVCDAALPPDVYWNTMLPDVPMPKVVREILPPGNTQKAVKDGKQPFYDAVSIEADMLIPIFYYAGKQPFYNAVKEPFYGASKDAVHDHDSQFVLEKDLFPGKKVNVDMIRKTTGVNFLPRELAEAIPFSTDQLTEIVENFSFKPQSKEARVMELSIKTCNQPAHEGEESHCATSLESMVDFVVYKMGRNVQSISTEIGTARQQYTSVEKVGGSNSILCHRLPYPYAVFYCHAIPPTRVYKLSLSSNENNSAILAICHADTSKWNPEFVAFKILKVKPGGTICHFLPEGLIVWTSDEASA